MKEAHEGLGPCDVLHLFHDSKELSTVDQLIYGQGRCQESAALLPAGPMHECDENMQASSAAEDQQSQEGQLKVIGAAAKYALGSVGLSVWETAAAVGGFGVAASIAQLVLRRLVSLRLVHLALMRLLFYITLSSTLVEPFRCHVHLNDLRTLQTDHDVFCTFSGTHLTTCLPISFLAICSHVLLVTLPRRVHVADARLLRICSFLVVRFKPGFENFAIVLLLRNLIFALSPMMPTSGALFLIGFLLAWSTLLAAFFRPWRSLLASIGLPGGCRQCRAAHDPAAEFAHCDRGRCLGYH